MDRTRYTNGPARGSYGQYPELPGSDSTVLHMKKTYWTAKQTILKKIGKKEDEHVVASDAELDAKLELFKQIEMSSVSLQRVIERYQSRLFVLSREENFLGIFLKGQGQEDKTRAGKMMMAVGKSECFSASQRTMLRTPLYRLYQEVETFRCRAIADTLVTVRRMEESRNEYRGALLWMKDASEELDPDTFKQLEKFRKVQGQVKQAKAKFDKFKLDVMQKVDLLAASRSNMFSHALAAYQGALLAFWEKTSRTMTAVSDCFSGYQYYEFNMLKELEEPSRKLMEQTAAHTESAQDSPDGLPGDKTSFDEVGRHSEAEQLIREILASVRADVPQRRDETLSSKSQPAPAEQPTQQLEDVLSLIDLEAKDALLYDDGLSKEDVFGDFQTACEEAFHANEDGSDSEQASLLQDVLGGGSSPAAASECGSDNDCVASDWGAAFGGTSDDMAAADLDSEEHDLLHDALLLPAASAGYLPSDLLELDTAMKLAASTDSTRCPQGGSRTPGMSSGSSRGASAHTAAGSRGSALLLPSSQPGAKLLGAGPASAEMHATKDGRQPEKGFSSASNSAKKKDLSSWYNLFADLDPLGNPDAVGKKDVDTSDQA